MRRVRMTGAVARAALGLTLGGSIACTGPSLDVPQAPGSSWAFALEPGDSLTATPVVFRGRLRHAPTPGEPWLFAGELSSYYVRALKSGELPTALRERVVPLRYWQEADDCVLQPLAPLEPGASYTLGWTGVGAVQALRTASDGPAPLRRLFPPPGRPQLAASVQCGMPAAAASADLRLEPGELELAQDQAWLREAAPGCSLLTATTPLEAPSVAPPAVAGALLDPSPWLPSIGSAASACARGQPLLDACIEADDDRVRVTPRREDQLWLLRKPALGLVVAPAGASSLLLRDVEPSAALELEGAVLTSSGQRDDFTLSLLLGPRRRHVVLNEVLANPLRAEASGEWIELVNDSARPARLGGLWLEDTSGHVPLPAVELGPFELALLVAPGFRAAAPDVPVASGTHVLELPTLGERGLANSGETLMLVGAEGVVSRFPALSAEHAGVSWARRTPDAPDDLASSFAEHAKPGASPGAPNAFDDP